jgi:NADH-quinone oxidoreductase subunit A
MAEYLPILFFTGFALFTAVVMLVIPHIVNPVRNSKHKLTPYECGFEAFDDARSRFDVRFYLVAILFVVFDLEVAFLFPWVMAFDQLGWFEFGVMMIFLAVLTIGFIYEWKKGALEWE